MVHAINLTPGSASPKHGRWAWFSDHHGPDDEVEAFVRVLYFQPVHHDEHEQLDKLVKKHGAEVGGCAS
jgi:hypothetical protein